MASSQAEAFHAQVRAFKESALGSADSPPSLEEMRAGAEAVMETVGTMPSGVTMERVELEGLGAYWLTPAEVRGSTVILFLHGGGYVLNSAHSHRKLAAHLAISAGSRVLSLDYRLAPEHPHPAAINDALTAYRWLIGKGHDSSSIGLSGDSAGGGLVVALMLAAKRDGLPQPGGAAIFSPWVDLEGIGESMDSKVATDLMVDRGALTGMAHLFLAGQSAHDPYAAPLYGDLTGLGPIYVQVGGDETLLDDSTRLVGKAAHAGVSVRLDVFPEMQHVFQTGVGMLPEADDAVKRVGDWYRTVLQ